MAVEVSKVPSSRPWAATRVGICPFKRNLIDGKWWVNQKKFLKAQVMLKSSLYVFFPEDAFDVITGFVFANTHVGGHFLKINQLLLNLFVGLNNHSGTPLLFSVDSRTRMSSSPS